MSQLAIQKNLLFRLLAFALDVVLLLPVLYGWGKFIGWMLSPDQYEYLFRLYIAPAPLPFNALQAVILIGPPLLYFVLLEGRWLEASFGKKLFKIALVGRARPCGYGRALIRYFSLVLFLYAIVIGPIWIGHKWLGASLPPAESSISNPSQWVDPKLQQLERLELERQDEMERAKKESQYWASYQRWRIYIMLSPLLVGLCVMQVTAIFNSGRTPWDIFSGSRVIPQAEARKIREAAAPVAAIAKPSWLMRETLSRIADLLIFIAIAVLGAFVTSSLAWTMAITYFLYEAYRLFMSRSRWQGTLGQRLMGLKVVSQEGRRISWSQSALRTLPELVPLAMSVMIVLPFSPTMGAFKAAISADLIFILPSAGSFTALCISSLLQMPWTMLAIPFAALTISLFLALWTRKNPLSDFLSDTMVVRL